MDWNSEEGRALLWKAYPDGYLAKRGVLTVGGWQCVADGQNRPEPYILFLPPKRNSSPEILWLPHQNTGPLVDAIPRGDLLPLPDPSDPATWACLLQDLAEASGRFEHQRPWVGFALDIWPDTPTPPGHRCWIFTVHDTGGRGFASFTLQESVTDADGGAEALIRAHASLR